MTDDRLAEIERVASDPARVKAAEDRTEDERVEVAVLNAYLISCVPEMLAELRRRGEVIVQMQQAIDEMGDSYD
jgi:hypothetical protein